MPFMEAFSKIFESLKQPNPFRDILTLVGGLIALLFFQIGLNINLLDPIEALGFGRIEADVIILVTSFVFGKILLSISDLLCGLFDMIFVFLAFFLKPGSLVENIKLQATQFMSGWKIKTKELLLGKEYGGVSGVDVRNQITELEMAKAYEDYPIVSNNIERKAYHMFFARMALAVTFVATMLISKYYFILFFLFLLQKISICRDIKYQEYLVYCGIVKKQAEKGCRDGLSNLRLS